MKPLRAARPLSFLGVRRQSSFSTRLYTRLSRATSPALGRGLDEGVLVCSRCRSASATRLLLAAGYRTSASHGSAWAAAVSAASSSVSKAVEVEQVALRADQASSADPDRFMAGEMKFLAENMGKLLGTGHPLLDRVAKYYTQSQGKHFRPLVVLLMASATSRCPKAHCGPSSPSAALEPAPSSSGSAATSVSADRKAWTAPAESGSALGQDSVFEAGGLVSHVDMSFSPLDILADFNPFFQSSQSDRLEKAAAGGSGRRSSTVMSVSWEGSDVLATQRRLAEITELIHTASLLHDDVIDHSVSRRGSPSANLAFGNKMAVLAGDFLLGRASVALARLRNAEVVELLSTVIANLVEGEFMQLKNTAGGDRHPTWSEDALSYYLRKTYLKTASLISKSCRATALLGRADGVTVEAAYAYGKSLGLAFQLVDDMLDYTRTDADLGKPAGADLKLGLATAPLLFAWQSVPELGALVGRRFEGDGDVEMARQLVLESDGIEKTRALAEDYSSQAVSAIRCFPESEAKDGLMEMATTTVKRLR